MMNRKEMLWTYFLERSFLRIGNFDFEISIAMDWLSDSTYEDSKLGLRVIASSTSYDTILKNMRAVGKEVYTVNEVTGFTTRGFYLNPPKTDTTVRLVLESESQSIAIEISKSKFPILKKLLSKK